MNIPNYEIIHSFELLSITKILLAKPLIKPGNLKLSFTICPSLSSNLYASQATCGFSDLPIFVTADLSYVKTIPPKPPYLLLMSKFFYYLVFPISCDHSAKRPPPDVEVAMLP